MTCLHTFQVERGVHAAIRRSFQGISLNYDKPTMKVVPCHSVNNLRFVVTDATRNTGRQSWAPRFEVTASASPLFYHLNYDTFCADKTATHIRHEAESSSLRGTTSYQFARHDLVELWASHPIDDQFFREASDPRSGYFFRFCWLRWVGR